MRRALWRNLSFALVTPGIAAGVAPLIAVVESYGAMPTPSRSA